MTGEHVAALGLGTALVVSAGLAWSGRWHRWAAIALLGPYPITVAPTLGALVVAYGLSPLLPEAVSTWLFATCLLSAVVGFVIYIGEPAWLGPRWYRTRHRGFDLSVHSNAAIAATIRPSPEQDSELTARRARAEQPVLTRRRVGLVGPEWGRPSALHTEGVVAGHLLFYTSELVFAADRTDDTLRGGPTLRRLPASSITTARRGDSRRQVIIGDGEQVWLVQTVRPHRLVADVAGHYGVRA